MRRLFLALAGATALTAASAANAAVTIGTGSSISLSGSVIASPAGDIRNANSLDFTSEVGVPSPGVAGTLAGYGTGTGAFAGVSCTNGNCGTIQDIASLAIGALPITNFFVLTGGNNASPIDFDLASINGIDGGSANFLTFSGSGTIRWADFLPTPATFLFSAQGNNITSFSATALTVGVPEPATWALMLLGFGGIGMAMRRRRRPVLAQLA